MQRRDFLRLAARLGLDPFVLQNTGGGGLTIIEALEQEIGPSPGSARFGPGRFRSLRRSTPQVVKSWEEPLPVIPARSSWLFSSRSLLAKPRQRKFISLSIISRPIVPLRSGNSWSEIVMF